MLWLLPVGLLIGSAAASERAQLPTTLQKRSSLTIKQQLKTPQVPQLLQIPRGGAIKKKSTKSSSAPANIKTARPPITDEGASIPSHVFNLIKSIVGAGVLGLPAGIAAFGDAPTAVLPALGLLMTIGSMSAYGFSLIGRLCYYTKSNTYREAWANCVSPKSGWVPALACLLVTGCSVLSYSMILSNTIPALANFVNKNIEWTATQGLTGITLTVLLPLCLLKNLKSLAPFSLLGIFGMFYTCAAMVFRFFNGNYKQVEMITEGGSTVLLNTGFLNSLDATQLPKFGSKGAAAILSPNAFMLISMLSTAFMAHYNAPKFYWELKDATLARFNTVLSASFVGSFLLMATVAVFGFGTFGGASQGLILNNYSTQDTFMTVSRFAVTLSLIFSYPLAFVGVRDGVLDMLQVPMEKRTDGKMNVLTVLLLAGVTVLALLVNDLRLVMAFGGATWGNAVTYLFPTYMMYCYCKTLAAKPKKSKQEENEYQSLKKELPLTLMNGALGLVMGMIGTVRAIQSM